MAGGLGLVGVVLLLLGEAEGVPEAISEETRGCAGFDTDGVTAVVGWWREGLQIGRVVVECRV